MTGNLPLPTMPVGPWARDKLNCLGKYLNAYTTILSKRDFKGYFYVDAFAGPGTLEVRRQDPKTLPLYDPTSLASHQYIAGSPQVALGIRNTFTDYVFVELDATRIAQLEALKCIFGSDNTRIHIRQEDCNAYLRRLLHKMENRWQDWRGVVFLDPFGMHVPWDTIAAIGATQALEIIINFPVGMAIQRLLRRDGKFSNEQRAKLDSYFGTDGWFELLYKRETNMSLLDEGAEIRYVKTPQAGDRLVKWYRDRLKRAFGHASAAREIQDTNGRPLYYLIFAGPNKTGAKIANDVLLKQGARVVR